MLLAVLNVVSRKCFPQNLFIYKIKDKTGVGGTSQNCIYSKSYIWKIIAIPVASFNSFVDIIFYVTSGFSSIFQELFRKAVLSTIPWYNLEMDSKEFKIRAQEVIDYMIFYKDHIMDTTVAPRMQLLENQLPILPKFIADKAPEKGESFGEIFRDVNLLFEPRILGWTHPHFFGYFGSGNSYASILADLISGIYGNVGFSWFSGPALTELEITMMDWYGQVLILPRQFYFKTIGGRGGGSLQCSASDGVFVSIVAARERGLEYLRKKIPGTNDYELMNRMVAYTSSEAHSCVEKGAIMALVRLRILKPNEKNSMTGKILEDAMKEDEAKGLYPFYYGATVGTTGTTAHDNLIEVGAVCKRRPLVWFHVDCAYAGSAFMCEEHQYLCEGLDYADSLNVNPNKWMTVAYDCSGLWVRDKFQFTKALVVSPTYLQNGIPGVIDYRHWQVQLSRRFRSLKLFFLFRSSGVEKLREYIRNHCTLAKYFEQLVKADDRFEVTSDVNLSCVCIRLKGDDKLTQHLVSIVNYQGKIHVTPTKDQGRYVMRVVVSYEFATEKHVEFAWKVIQENALSVERIMEKIPDLLPSRRLSNVVLVDEDILEKLELHTRDLADPIPVHHLLWSVYSKKPEVDPEEDSTEDDDSPDENSRELRSSVQLIS